MCYTEQVIQSHLPLRKVSTSSTLTTFHFRGLLSDIEMLWTTMRGGQSIKSSFWAKASAMGKTSGDHVIVSSGTTVFHPNKTHIALWRPKCCDLSPTLWDMKACVTRRWVSKNSFEWLKQCALLIITVSRETWLNN